MPLINGAIPTSEGSLYTNTEPPNGGANKIINFFRVVNESGAARTFTLYFNVNGTARAFTPVSTQLPIGAAYDDIPVVQLPPTGIIRGIASGTGVSWTINVE